MSTVAIDKFLQTAYSDDKLAALLAHAEDGKLSFGSCCCLIGSANADHTLQQSNFAAVMGTPFAAHLLLARELPFAKEAEKEFDNLADSNSERREIVIPLIKAEIARRDALKEAHCPCGDTCPTCDPESALEAQQQAEECSDMNVFHRY